MKKQLDDLANKNRFFRRSVLIWSMGLITYFVAFLMDHAFLVAVTAPGATVVTAVIGILTSVIAFYQWHRSKDDEKEMKLNEDNTDDTK